MTETLIHPPSRRPIVHLIYAQDRLPAPNETALQRCLGNSGAENGPLGGVDWAQQDFQKHVGRATFAGHQLHIAGLPIPLPREIIDHTVMVSPWSGQIKAAMRQHRAHISLVYAQGSSNPIEQMIALYSLACAFSNEDLLGIVNANAWTAHPPADFLEPAQIASYRRDIPFNLWFGYVRFFTDAQTFWLATKGHHVFDVPDLAYQVDPNEDPDEVIRLFMNVFHYLYEQDVFVTAGDTLEISGTGQTLVFEEVTELEDVLMGPSGTLVLKKAVV